MSRRPLSFLKKLSNLDMIVCGEGEKTFEKVVDYFKKIKNFQKISMVLG